MPAREFGLSPRKEVACRSFSVCCFSKGSLRVYSWAARLYVQCKGGTTKSAFEGWKLSKTPDGPTFAKIAKVGQSTYLIKSIGHSPEIGLGCPTE